MNTVFKFALIIILGLTLNSQVMAQGIKIPQPSSGQTLIQDFGLGKITVVYSRPNTKGRKVFGELEPYGSVWRTGANNATTISFTEEVTLEGKTVPAGDYALFTIPGKSEWTVILNKSIKQWGAYEYKESEDFLRVKVKPSILKDKVETFTIHNTSVAVNLATDIDAKVMASIDEAMKGDKKPYMQAAQYYFSNGKDINKAMEWINAADTPDGKAPWVKLWKGRIQLKMGDKAGAAKSATEGIKIATEIKNPEYIRLNTALLAETK
jgi:hypothetical protein